MSKYEIMLILDPNSDEKVVSEIAKSTFKSKSVKVERLERTELAYEINKSKTAIYVLVNVEATGEEINEFMRKANITKNIWRSLSINLDTEKGLNRKAKPKKIKRQFGKRNFAEKTNNEEVQEVVKTTEDEKPKKVSKAKSATKEKSEEKPKKTSKSKSKKLEDESK